MESIREESQKRIMWRFNLASSTIGVEKLMFAGVHQFQTKKKKYKMIPHTNSKILCEQLLECNWFSSYYFVQSVELIWWPSANHLPHL